MGKALKLSALVVPEAALLSSIKTALEYEPRVAWVARMNSGSYVVGQGKDRRYVRYGFPGLSDLIGQLTTGEFFSIEVKREGRDPTDLQRSFIDKVNANNGHAGVARSIDEALSIVRKGRKSEDSF